MFKKNFYVLMALSIFSTFSSFAIKVETTILFQIGDKIQKSTVMVDSEEYTELSMDGESLGFAIKLHDAKKGNERFETVPTYNKKPITRHLYSGKRTQIGAGLTLNGHAIEKDLALEFVEIKHLV